MSDIRKRVDESWKEQVEKEKQHAEPAPSSAAMPPEGEGETETEAEARPAAEPAASSAERAGQMPEARFDLFLSGLAIDALIGLGDMPNPATKKASVNLAHARYLIDLLGVLEEKTKGNLSADEDRLLKDTLYQLRMRYLNKTGK